MYTSEATATEDLDIEFDIRLLTNGYSEGTVSGYPGGDIEKNRRQVVY